MWKPISEGEMQVFLDEEIARLDELTRPTWKKHRSKLALVPSAREGSDRTGIYVVARAGSEVIVFDDASEQFGTAMLGDDGVIRDWTTYGEHLSHALRHFPKRGGRSKA